MNEQVKFNPLPPALTEVKLPPEWGWNREQGKVRDIYKVGNYRLLIATDRLSAFDRQVGVIPGRGQILNQLSAWWFEQTSDILPNHVVAVPDPNVMVVQEYPRIDLEMVVRGFNTGSTKTSIWTRYEAGERQFGSLHLPEGMRKYDPLPQPILDPTTKANVGHDENVNREAILASGVVSRDEYELLELYSLALFKRGQRIAANAGLILVDTKYEFGRDPDTGNIVLIDEVHTPDSSRFWAAATYIDRMREGQHPEMYDKEYARLWFSNQGYHGEGEPPQMPPEIVTEVRDRYIFAYEGLLGKPFEPDYNNPHARVVDNIQTWYWNHD